MNIEKNSKRVPPEELPISDVSILGIIVSRSYMSRFYGITGKDIIIEMKEAKYPNWVDIQYSTIYNCLNRLEGYGYLVSQEDVANRRRIKKYFSTKRGKEALFNHIEKYLSNPIQVKNPFDLAIGYIGLLDKNIAINSLKNYLIKTKESIRYLKSYVDGLKNGKVGDKAGHILLNESMMPILQNLLAHFERPYEELKARSQWLEEFIQKVKEDKIMFVNKKSNNGKSNEI